MTIQSQKKFKAAIQIFKCLQGTAVPNLTSYIEKVDHKYNTRGNSSTLRLPKVRAEAARRSFRFQGPSCYNELPIDIRKLTSIIDLLAILQKSLDRAIFLYILMRKVRLNGVGASITIVHI